MADKLQTVPECDLGFEELHETRTTTIIFLHGAFSSSLECSLVTPHLQDYHILAPALHANPKSLSPKPAFTLENICAQIAALIQVKAKNGQAHVYGHSMGAHLAIQLASLHPEQVLATIASGITLISQFPWYTKPLVPTLLYTLEVLPRVILPKQVQTPLFNAIFHPASPTIVEQMLQQPFSGDWATFQEVCACLMKSLPRDSSIRIGSRILIIAGTGRPSDPIKDARWVVDMINAAGGTAQGAEIKKGGHPWLVQLPELCAAVIRAWIEAEQLPEDATPFK